MGVYLSNITDGGATPALIKTIAFTESRLQVIAENVANSETPGYRAKQLDPDAFRAALRDALETRREQPRSFFRVDVDGQVTTTEDGFLAVTPTDAPVDNVLFHDGTNMSIEREMVDLAETNMAHEMATVLLTGYFDMYRKAIRGTVG